MVYTFACKNQLYPKNPVDVSIIQVIKCYIYYGPNPISHMLIKSYK